MATVVTASACSRCEELHWRSSAAQAVQYSHLYSYRLLLNDVLLVRITGAHHVAFAAC
jgi:hypothetical protein